MSAIQLALAYCFCNSAGGLCNACCGNTEGTGRKRSVLLLSLAASAALTFQYYVAPSLLSENGWWYALKVIPGFGKRIHSSWIMNCDQYEKDLYVQCVGNSGVYRPMFLSTVFFLVAAVATKFNSKTNSLAWPSKYAAFFFFLIVTMIIPNGPIFDDLYLHVSRAGALIFILVQQVILIDLAYNWNERWLEKSNRNNVAEWGSGNKWLLAILAMCITLYSIAFTGIGLLYKYFSGCPGNTTIITLSLIGIFIITGIQLSGSEGSLLTSAVISLYSAYLAYASVSKNPNAICNPTIGKDDTFGIVFGLILTVVSLGWTGWSWTAEERLIAENVTVPEAVPPSNSNSQDLSKTDLDMPFLDPNESPATGIVIESDEIEDISSDCGNSLWKLNVVLSLISCWVAASLTGWGSIQGGIGNEGAHTAANPQVGEMNMIMITISQWIALLLYIWTLIAPKLYPDRDFS